ncbi:transcriptional regulator [Sodalis sp. (in: enterobacteria)]|uniref:transcriptional regulator n=1 Tax=Sodalis sp. (in: enterobacteria) TaxID=1898979 RepID=UPI0039E4F619
MKMFDPAQHPELRNLFPELTPVQFETSFFSIGCSQKEISVLCSVAYKVVKQAIAEAKSKFETQSLTGLLTAFHICLVLFALYGCQGKQPKSTTPLTQG